MKERLTGAIILVALMVLLVPELLTGPIRTKSPPAASATAAAAPAAPAGRTARAQAPLETYTLALQPSPSARGVIAATLPQGQPGESAPDGGPGQGRAASGRHPAPTSSTRGSAAASPQEAAPAPAKILEHGNGPQRAAGNAPSSRSQSPQPPGLSRLGARTEPGLQVAKPPAHPPVREARSSASSRGWVVQLGSFADHRNALHLARSLEAKGIRMSVSRARAGSRVLWRVRTGLAHDRAGAEHLAARLRALGHRGEVLPVR
ncbi:MAG TPA: SPOR domain-containing protein [Steroidobacteraceae bacterium]|nr:SPOR domain-containing protein [Steroidobacteraceae bacterium]